MDVSKGGDFKLSSGLLASGDALTVDGVVVTVTAPGGFGAGRFFRRVRGEVDVDFLGRKFVLIFFFYFSSINSPLSPVPIDPTPSTHRWPFSPAD